MVIEELSSRCVLNLLLATSDKLCNENTLQPQASHGSIDTAISAKSSPFPFDGEAVSRVVNTVWFTVPPLIFLPGGIM
jgi:hypothetical protein